MKKNILKSFKMYPSLKVSSKTSVQLCVVRLKRSAPSRDADVVHYSRYTGYNRASTNVFFFFFFSISAHKGRHGTLSAGHRPAA